MTVAVLTYRIIVGRAGIQRVQALAHEFKRKHLTVERPHPQAETAEECIPHASVKPCLRISVKPFRISEAKPVKLLDVSYLSFTIVCVCFYLKSA